MSHGKKLKVINIKRKVHKFTVQR